MSQAYENAIIRRDFRSWDCVGTAPAWGQSRQALISILPWFHNVQSGFARSQQPINGDRRPACGLLANDYGGKRNYLDSEIVIISINGSDNTADNTQLRMNAMREAIADNCLVGLMVAKGATNEKTAGTTRSKIVQDKGEAFFPAKKISLENFECFVVDWFLPVLMWPEAVPDDGQGKSQNDKKSKNIWMVKMQKERLGQQGWWADRNHPLPPRLEDRDFSKRIVSQSCKICGKTSPLIYNEGFVCFQLDCSRGPSYLGDRLIKPDEPLSYTDDLLKERLDPRGITVTGPPGYPNFAPQFQYTATTGQTWTDDSIKLEMSKHLEAAMCLSCKMVVLRKKWTGWECQNGNCNFPLRQNVCPPKLSVQDATTLCITADKLFNDQDLDQVFQQKYPNYYRGFVEDNLFKTYNFELMNECKVAFMDPKKGTNQIVNGSDHLFDRIQELACKDSRVNLLRRPTKQGFLTNHFNQNFGEPYQMTVMVDNTTFDQAPTEIQKAVDKANEWTQSYRDASDSIFNEMYIAAYLKDQSMSGHQDNEHGLGDKILTWSLGGCGVFKISVRADLCKGKLSTGRWIAQDPVVTGCRKYDERLALKTSLEKGEIDQAEWAAKFQQLMDKETGSEGREVLRFPSTHGRLCLMYGKDMQTNYQHRMDVVGPMRFALTFRYIDGTSKAPGKRKAVRQEATGAGSTKDGNGPPDGNDASKDKEPSRKSRRAPGSGAAPQRMVTRSMTKSSSMK